MFARAFALNANKTGTREARPRFTGTYGIRESLYGRSGRMLPFSYTRFFVA